MKRIAYTLAAASFCLACSCKQSDKKTEAPNKAEGVEHQVFKLGHGAPIVPGNYMKMNIIQKYNDSVLSDTHNGPPRIAKYDSLVMSPESFAIFKGVAEGDSLVFSVPADSAFKNGRPPFAQNRAGGYINTFVKILHIYRSHDEVVAETGETDY